MFESLLPPESLHTVNFVDGPSIGAISLVLVFSCIFALLSFTIIRKSSLSRSGKLMSLLAAAWLPLFILFLVSSGRDFITSQSWLGRSLDEQEDWHYCEVDVNQHLAGRLCVLPNFVRLTRKILPSDATLAFWPSELWPYLIYGLYDPYTVTANLPDADYLIVYRPSTPFSFEHGALYSFPEGKEKERTLIGKYAVFAAFGPKEFIFKRLP